MNDCSIAAKFSVFCHILLAFFLSSFSLDFHLFYALLLFAIVDASSSVMLRRRKKIIKNLFFTLHNRKLCPIPSIVSNRTSQFVSSVKQFNVFTKCAMNYLYVVSERGNRKNKTVQQNVLLVFIAVQVVIQRNLFGQRRKRQS